MAQWEFPGSDPVDVVVDIPAGQVTLAAEPTDVISVRLAASRPGSDAERLISAVRVDFTPGRLEVTGPKRAGLWRGHALDLAITVPPGSSCAVRTAAANVSCTGEVADLDVRTASGDISAAVVTGRAKADTASGNVALERAGADADVSTSSGDIRLALAGGDVSVHTASGTVSIGSAGGSVDAQTATGDIRIASMTAGRGTAETVSGNVLVGVAAGAGAYLDLASLTGSVTSQLDEADADEDISLEIKCRTVSGNIKITRAAVPGHQGGPALADGPVAAG